MAYTKPLDSKDKGYWWAKVSDKTEIVHLDENLLVSIIGTDGKRSLKYWNNIGVKIELLSFIEDPNEYNKNY